MHELNTLRRSLGIFWSEVQEDESKKSNPIKRSPLEYFGQISFVNSTAITEVSNSIEEFCFYSKYLWISLLS